MNRYKKTFKKHGKKLIPFTVVGDPDYNTSIEIIKTMINAGADILELAAPFSDPIADGPTIQAADVRALKHKINTDKFFQLIREIRDFNNKIPIGILIYANLVYQRGIEKFYKDAKQAGIDSILVADLPIEEATNYIKAAKRAGVETVFIVSPLTDNNRLKKITSKTTGFVYIVSRLGVTGARAELKKSTLELIKRVRKQTNLPLCVGFGISKPEHVKEVIKAGADGVIVGSAIVKIIEENLKDKDKMLDEIRGFIVKLKKATGK